VPDPVHTVIVPAYNAAETIESAIRSVQAQTTPSFEVIVVDDGSTDATAAVLERIAADHPRITVISQPNAGPSAARNTAIDRAAGAYLTFLDSDDLLMPAYLEAVEASFATDPAVGLVHVRAWVIDEAGGGRVRRAVWPAPGYVAGAGPEPDQPADAVVALAAGN
jgi:glycosyltransferase involved in cell wall biosynthesis